MDIIGILLYPDNIMHINLNTMAKLIWKFGHAMHAIHFLAIDSLYSLWAQKNLCDQIVRLASPLFKRILFCSSMQFVYCIQNGSSLTKLKCRMDMN